MVQTKFKNKKPISPNILGRSYGETVLTHAVPTQKILFSILKDGTIKLPSSKPKDNQYLNKFFNIHNCVYFSPGWDYNSTFHHWPFAFIFKKSILKNEYFEFFKTFLISQGWMTVLRYWRDNDKKYLEKLSNSSKIAKQEIEIFLKKDAATFWIFEKELETFLRKYPKRKEVFKVLSEFRKRNVLENNYSIRYLNKHYFDNFYIRKMEIVSHKSVSLDSPEFIGLYIEKSKLKQIIPKITKLIDKKIIIFDGTRKHFILIWYN